MATDTVKLVSPYIGSKQAARIEQNCRRKQSIEIATGALDYSITAGSLEGSWDDRVSVRVERDEVVSLSTRGAVVSRKCDPYLVVEGSVHKALLGHNIHGGPTDFVAACRWLIGDLAGRLWCDLPNADDWRVQKVDETEVYELPSYEAVQEYIAGLNQASFPRRRVARYSDESLHCPGSTTVVKIYHKGPEVWTHDFKRLVRQFGESTAHELLDRANRMLRFEISIRARKLAEDFKGKPRVVQVTQDYLQGVHDREATRLLREAQSDMQTVRTHLEVSRRLQQMYSAELASRLFGTWLQLAALGEKEVGSRMSRPTYYRQRKQLMDAGCSWHATDVVVTKLSAIPAGFSPTRMDPRRLLSEAPEVVYQLAPFRLAA